MKHNIKRAALALIIFSAVVLAANISASIKVGVDGSYRFIRMPLYVKWTQFLARHYEYGRLSKEITARCKTDEEKVLAILKWTKDNLKDVLSGMPVCDDHILSIVIRGYAVPEQFQDVFTTLCAYSGIPAYYGKPYDNSRKVKYAISFVKLNGKWRVFDAYYGLYFRANSGEIAGVDDIIRNPSIVSGNEIETLTVRGAPYKEFYNDLSSIAKPRTTRPERQMPFPRAMFEIKKAAKIEKEE